jgi:hypothetical protein
MLTVTANYIDRSVRGELRRARMPGGLGMRHGISRAHLDEVLLGPATRRQIPPEFKGLTAMPMRRTVRRHGCPLALAERWPQVGLLNAPLRRHSGRNKFFAVGCVW